MKMGPMGSNLVTAYIGLGSNLGDRSKNLSGAMERLSRVGNICSASTIFKTKPWGVSDYQPSYFNQVAGVLTSMDPLDVVVELLGIEHSLGRIRRTKNDPRTVDLDLLLHGSAVLKATGVTVPHPRLHERAFVLVPLAEIAPNYVHPIFGVTIAQLAKDSDSSGVRRLL